VTGFSWIGKERTMVELLKSRPHLFDSIQVAFLLTDAHSSILYANQSTEDLFGYSRSEMEGKRVRMLFLDEDLIYLLPNIIYLSLYQDGFKGELLLRQRGGSEIFVHLFTTCFKEREETYITFTFQEIQRLKSLERKRLEDEHWTRLGHMVEEIAHQVRNPIVSIGGYANRLLRAVPLLQKSRSYLTKLLEEACRLERMIQRIETYIEISNPSFRKEKVQDVAEEVLRIFSRRIPVKRISVNLEAGGIKGEGGFFIDREWVTQALLNLLENSLEAVTGMRKKGASIVVTLFEGEENIGISISDNGQGIQKKNLGLIFEPFFTTHPERVGLGLPFVKRVIEGHGGEIQIESRFKKGTNVTLYFPRDRRRRVRRELISTAGSSLSCKG
jgi:two-component system sensor histidine kinase HydH